MFSDEQREILSEYTDNLDVVESISYYDYTTKLNSKQVSQILDDYHAIWFHDDPGKLYLVAKNNDTVGRL